MHLSTVFTLDKQVGPFFFFFFFATVACAGGYGSSSYQESGLGLTLFERQGLSGTTPDKSAML